MLEVSMGGGKGGGGSAPYQNELAQMFAGQNMLTLAQRNPYAASMFRPDSDLGKKYQEIFGTSALPAARPFRLDPIGAYSTAESRVYGGAQPELNMARPPSNAVQPGNNFGNMPLPPPQQPAQAPVAIGRGLGGAFGNNPGVFKRFGGR